MATGLKSSELIELSEADREAVLLQIERLLASPHFRNSRRYTDLLRYVVQQTIEGHADILKERTLGIEVFGREPGFDTAGDSIVRVAVAEVRKRIAQYYQEEGHENELRIDLPSGSYVPHFRYPTKPVSSPVLEIPSEELTPRAPVSHRSVQMKYATSMAIFLLASLAIGVVIYLTLPSAATRLLRPFWAGRQDTMICIGSPLLKQNQPGAEDSAALALGQPTTNNTVLPFADAMVLSGFQVLLNSHHKPNRVQLARDTTFNDLRSGPTILIGAFDNPWTLRLTGTLRFRFQGTDGGEGQIIDSKGKPESRWSVDFHVPYSDRTQDYAIVAITHDDLLDQSVLVAAGIGPNGTMAAGEFLLKKSDLDAVARRAPPNWTGKNVELVLATQVIQGNSGPPRIVAAEYW